MGAPSTANLPAPQAYVRGVFAFGAIAYLWPSPQHVQKNPFPWSSDKLILEINGGLSLFVDIRRRPRELGTWYRWTRWQGRDREKDVENYYVVCQGGRESGMSWEIRIEAHALLTVVVHVVSNFLSPTGCSPPGSSVPGSLQARRLEWVAISSSRGSSRLRDQPASPTLAGGFFTI